MHIQVYNIHIIFRGWVWRLAQTAHTHKYSETHTHTHTLILAMFYILLDGGGLFVYYDYTCVRIYIVI